VVNPLADQSKTGQAPIATTGNASRRCDRALAQHGGLHAIGQHLNDFPDTAAARVLSLAGQVSGNGVFME
jgi:hypothetical protein